MAAALGASRIRPDESPDPVPAFTEPAGGIDPGSPTETDSGQGQVAALAYRFWEERGRPIGSPEED
jgi:hypothetical protein